jgi:hypothetical protein
MAEVATILSKSLTPRGVKRYATLQGEDIELKVIPYGAPSRREMHISNRSKDSRRTIAWGVSTGRNGGLVGITMSQHHGPVVKAARTKMSAAKEPKIPQEPKKFGKLVEHEMYLLICTNNKRYAAARRQIQTHGGKSQTIIISTIAVAIGSVLGLALGVISSFVCVILFAFLSVGKNAFCKKLAR